METNNMNTPDLIVTHPFPAAKEEDLSTSEISIATEEMDGGVQPLKEEKKASLVSKPISELVSDLRYSQGMLEANIQTAKETRKAINKYLTRTNMAQYADIVRNMTEAEINSMTKKDIDNKFPGHEIVDWEDPAVRGDGDYGYTEDEYHQFIIDLKNKLYEYESLVKLIDKAKDYVANMSKMLQEARIKYAEKVAKNNTPEGNKAKQFLSDINNINRCDGFFTYVMNHASKIANSNYQYIKDRFDTWCSKNQRYEDILDTIKTTAVFDADDADREFLCKCLMGYVIYGDNSDKRHEIIKKSILNNLKDYFEGNIDEADAFSIKASIQSIFLLSK